MIYVDKLLLLVHTYSFFQGKRVELKLKVFSSFAQEMSVDSVFTVPPDPRFSFRPALDKGGGNKKILPDQKNYIGKVVFDPGSECETAEECYVGFAADSKLGREWLQGLSLPPSLADSDSAVAHTLHKRGLKALQPSSYFNITLNLDTSQVRGFLFSARATLVWPRVVRPPSQGGQLTSSGGGGGSSKKSSGVAAAAAKEVEEEDDEAEEGEDSSTTTTTSSSLLLEFPLTQVGNSSFRDLLLANPSPQRPLLVHLVPLAAYPSGAKAAIMLPSR